MVPSTSNNGGMVGAAQGSADQGARHPSPPFCSKVTMAPQDGKDKGSCSEPLQKTFHTHSIAMEADRQAALQGGRGDRVFCAASGCADQPHATEEGFSVCTGGNPNIDLECAKEECSRQSIP